MRIAAYQGPCVSGDLKANMHRTLQVYERAASDRVDFLAMPETFLSGYGVREHVERAAVAADGPELKPLYDATRNAGTVLLVGFSERRGDKLFNSVAVIHDGELLGAYSKTMLTNGDSKQMGFSWDAELPVFEAKGIVFGVQICADTSYAEPSRVLALKGATLIFTPHFNHMAYENIEDHRQRVRNNHIAIAVRNEVYVAKANSLVAEVVEKAGYGDSYILDHRGVVLVEAGMFVEGIIGVDVPDEDLKPRRRRFHRVPPEVRAQLTEEAYEASSGAPSATLSTEFRGWRLTQNLPGASG